MSFIEVSGNVSVAVYISAYHRDEASYQPLTPGWRWSEVNDLVPPWNGFQLDPRDDWLRMRTKRICYNRDEIHPAGRFRINWTLVTIRLFYKETWAGYYYWLCIDKLPHPSPSIALFMTSSSAISRHFEGNKNNRDITKTTLNNWLKISFLLK